jgi:hypothetical protein
VLRHARRKRTHAPPVIIRGNGMFALSAIYTGLLAHFASYSFIVAAAG